MADNLNYLERFIPTRGIGQSIDEMVESAQSARRNFEKRWYDNNFFDDGHHFRYVSRSTGKIVDLTEGQAGSFPIRAIPKASRQIRGVANLLLAPEYTPVIYPEQVTSVNYQDQQEYMEALKLSKDTAKKIGHWLSEEWKKQRIKEKLIYMVLLSAKHGVSYLQVWPDAVEEKIRVQTFDAFDIFLLGNYSSIYDCPFIIKASPKLISNIKANESFDKDQVRQLHPDNKYASSEIKEAYMRSRYGKSGEDSDRGATLILKEAFIKEYINDLNVDFIRSKFNYVLRGKKKGDVVMRHVFSVGGVWLKDEYVDLPDYPFVDFRFEPGPIYQTALMERFIPANKSLDMIMSRIERYANTMVTGTWLKRKGENFEITNIPGGQTLEYETTPPVQANLASVPPFMFSLIQVLEKIIEEQGASTAALNQLPEGVKSGVAIESLKATEYANLKISADQLKNTVRTIGEKMIDIAANHFIQPQTVMYLERGEPSYFDIIGQRGIDARKAAKIDIPQAVPIKGDYVVDIQVESGLGFTAEGRRSTIQQITEFMRALATEGYLTPEAVNVAVEKLLDTFGFGATQEFMEAIRSGTPGDKLNNQQIAQMKIAIAEVLRDLGIAGQAGDQKMVDSTKVGMMETMQDLMKGGGANAA